jgi:signal transduction histidine kinase
MQDVDDGQATLTARCEVCGTSFVEWSEKSNTEEQDCLCPNCGTGSLAPSRLLNALARLNQISSTISQFGSGDQSSVEATLRLIVESAVEVIPGASSVIYTYDEAGDGFDPSSRVSAGEHAGPMVNDQPRANGMGRRAIDLRRRTISYEESDLTIHDMKVDAGARAVVCSPLVVAGQSVGVLYVYLHEDRRFSQLELLMLDNFVNQAAMAIYHAHQVSSVERDLSRKEEELARLRRAGLLISSRPRLEETLEAIIQMALEITNAQYGVFRLVDQDAKNLSIAAIAGEGWSQPLSKILPLNATNITGWVARQRQPLLITDLREEPWASIYHPLGAEEEMRSELAVPMIGASGRLEGILNLESPQIAAFNEQDSHLLQSLATQAVIAIQEIRLVDALQEVARLLLVKPRQEVLNHLAELACTLLNATSGAIWLLDGDTLVLQASSSGHEHDESVPLHRSLVGQALLERQPIVSDNVKTDPLFHRSDLARAQGWTQALAVPLLADVEQDPVGAFAAYSIDSESSRLAESEWDKKVLTILAHYAVLAIQTANRRQALRAAEEQRTVAETFAVLGDIAANLLHELNNKVGIIPVRVQGILDKSRAAVDSDQYLLANIVEIERSATEAMATVRENLALLRPITPVPLDVASCVDEAIGAASLPDGISVDIDSPQDAVPFVLGGEQSLRLVFTNLLQNAARAMGDRGLISIAIRPEEEWVEVAIRDTGPGIASELQSHIFEFSYSGHAPEQPDKLGFGLWWVKTLITRLGGSVTVKSTVGQGTTIRLRLPRVHEHL